MAKCYESTRNPAVKVSAKEAVLQGISPDGGLFVRPDLKQLTVDLDQVLAQSWKENAVMILDTLLDDYSKEELEEACSGAYNTNFTDEKTTPVVKVGNLDVLELFHGPTSAFKDVALTLLPRLMSKALEGTQEKALVLTATSGDTGKAALSGFQDVKNTGIAVFYPHNGVSAMQYRQMACQPGNNVKVFAVEGNFDDAQTAVKKLFLDEDLNNKMAEKGIRLSSANSINVGRLVPQVVYYFDAYKQLVQQGKIQKGEQVVFAVPTGNFGDVLAGFYACCLGLPVKKFIVASNANDVLAEFLSTGIYDRRRPFFKTISPSMDILVSSNLERLLYYMTGEDHEKVASWMKQLNEEGRYQVDDATLARIQELFAWGSLDDAHTKKVIKDVYEKTGYVLDPHTAVGYGVAEQYKTNRKENQDDAIVVLATASPYKFSKDVLSALGEEIEDDWAALHRLAQLNPQPVPAGLANLETARILHDDLTDPAGMKEAVVMTAEKCQ